MKLLRIAILAQLDSVTITGKLAPMLRDRGHKVDIIDLSSMPEKDFMAQQEIQSLSSYDVVYYRTGLDPNSNSARIVQLEEFLKNHSVKMVNLNYTEYPDVHSKSFEVQQAEKYGLEIPASVYLPTSFLELSESLGLPFVVKTNFGTNGKGVHMVKNAKDFVRIQSLYPNTQLLYQTFIPHDFEYRVHIADGVVDCIYKKAPPDGDFRSNEAQGGLMLAADPEHIQKITELAIKTYEAFKFNLYVADFMLDKNTDTFYFTEINLNPGWGETDEDATGVDLISLNADYFEKICSTLAH